MQTETSVVIIMIVIFMLCVWRYVVPYKTDLELNWCFAILISRGLIWQRASYSTRSSWLFCTKRVVVVTDYWSSDYLHHELVDRTRYLKSNAPQNDGKDSYHGKNAPQARFCLRNNAGKIYNAPQARFLDWILIGSLSYRTCWCNLNLKIISPESRTRDFTILVEVLAN